MFTLKTMVDTIIIPPLFCHKTIEGSIIINIFNNHKFILPSSIKYIGYIGSDNYFIVDQNNMWHVICTIDLINDYYECGTRIYPNNKHALCNKLKNVEEINCDENYCIPIGPICTQNDSIVDVSNQYLAHIFIGKDEKEYIIYIDKKKKTYSVILYDEMNKEIYNLSYLIELNNFNDTHVTLGIKDSHITFYIKNIRQVNYIINIPYGHSCSIAASERRYPSLDFMYKRNFGDNVKILFINFCIFTKKSYIIDYDNNLYVVSICDNKKKPKFITNIDNVMQFINKKVNIKSAQSCV